MAADRLVGDALEVELERLLEEGASFPPSQEFVGSALISDTAVWDRADADPVGFWEEQARELVWAKPWDTALDDSNPPFYDWFKGGRSTRLTTALTAMLRLVLATGSHFTGMARTTPSAPSPTQTFTVRFSWPRTRSKIWV